MEDEKWAQQQRNAWRIELTQAQAVYWQQRRKQRRARSTGGK